MNVDKRPPPPTGCPQKEKGETFGIYRLRPQTKKKYEKLYTYAE